MARVTVSAPLMRSTISFSHRVIADNKTKRIMAWRRSTCAVISHSKASYFSSPHAPARILCTHLHTRSQARCFVVSNSLSSCISIFKAGEAAGVSSKNATPSLVPAVCRKLLSFRVGALASTRRRTEAFLLLDQKCKESLYYCCKRNYDVLRA